MSNVPLRTLYIWTIHEINNPLPMFKSIPFLRAAALLNCTLPVMRTIFHLRIKLVAVCTKWTPPNVTICKRNANSKKMVIFLICPIRFRRHNHPQWSHTTENLQQRWDLWLFPSSWATAQELDGHSVVFFRHYSQQNFRALPVAFILKNDRLTRKLVSYNSVVMLLPVFFRFPQHCGVFLLALPHKCKVRYCCSVMLLPFGNGQNNLQHSHFRGLISQLCTRIACVYQ